MYSPTKKSEILEAERAKDEMRDIMSRMIGAEIRYVRLGYRVRQAPYGYVNEKIETSHGKRVVLAPHPEEAHWIQKMFDLRIQGNLSDNEIVDEINKMGFRTRTQNRRNPNDKKQVIGKIGGNLLNIKQFWRLIYNPIYAGVNVESWTQDQAIKGQFKGLVSIDIYNTANRGKRTLVEDKDGIKFFKERPPERFINKGIRNKDFPFKRVVMCPECEKPLFGSASRGKMGKYYPAYHCNKRGHYFRVSKGDFDSTIAEFVKGLKFEPDYAEKLMEAVMQEWDKRQKNTQSDKSVIEKKIQELENSARLIADKIRILSSETAIRYMEEDLTKIETEMLELKDQLTKKDENTIDLEEVTGTVKYFLEHLEDLLLDQSKPEKSATLFSLIFQMAPTYAELVSGTPKLAPFVALKDDYAVSENQMVSPPGLEPGTQSLKGSCSNQLSYGPTESANYSKNPGLSVYSFLDARIARS